MKKYSLSVFALGILLMLAPAFSFAGSSPTKNKLQERPGRILASERVEEGLVELPKLEETTFAAEKSETNTLESPMALKANKKMRKSMRRQARKLMWKKMFSPNKVKEVDMVLIIVLTIIIPPLGVYLFEGAATTDFWVDLILTLIGFWILGIIYGLLVITNTIDLG